METEVYFIDRATPGGIVLAKACANQGALVVFEPASIGNPVLFRQAWEISHVVKYSHERLRELPEVDAEGIQRLQVETLGEAGLRYRRVSENGRAGRWLEMEAFSVESIRDTAGSGDWCTAGFIDRAGRSGAEGFFRMSDADLADAFRYGQALAAWNCKFEGARGGMYAVDHQAFEFRIREILKGHNERSSLLPALNEEENVVTGLICPACIRADTGHLATGTSGHR